MKRAAFGSFLLLNATTTALVALTPAASRADVDYRPVQFFDAGLSQRPDLAGRAERLQTPIADSRGVHDQDIERRRYGNVEISIYAEVAHFAQGLIENRPVEYQPTSSLSVPGCAQNAGFGPKQLPNGKTSFLCRVRTAAYEVARGAGWENSCAETALPESYIYRHGQAKVDPLDLNSIEGLIATAGEPLARMDLPPAFTGVSIKEEMRIILRKVRLESLRAQLMLRQTQLNPLIDGLKNQGDCIKSDPATINSVLERLRGIRQENEQMLSYLNQLESEGRALAAQDRASVEQIGRMRSSDLPFPWMTDRERKLLSMSLGAIFWRMRGGGLVSDPKGTQLTRIYFTQLPMTAISILNGGTESVGFGTDIFVRLFKEWGDWMDMGQMPGQKDEYVDLISMSERGLYQVQTAMGTLGEKRFANDALQIGGMMMGPCYYLAVKDLRNNLVSPTPPLPYREFIDGFPAWGEFCSGAVISLGLSKSLLAGKQP